MDMQKGPSLWYTSGTSLASSTSLFPPLNQKVLALDQIWYVWIINPMEKKKLVHGARLIYLCTL